MAYKYFVVSLVMIGFFANIQARDRGAFTVGIGPAWNSIELNIVPSFGKSFLESTDFIPEWNILPWIKGSLEFYLKSWWNVYCDVGGGWMRFGRAIVRESIFLEVEVNHDFPSIMLGDFFDIDVGMGFTLHTSPHFTLKSEIGYAYGFDFRQLDIIQTTRILYARGNYQGPAIGFKCLAHTQHLDMGLAYKMVIGKFHIVETENDSNISVIRTAPGFTNSVGVTISYKLNENMKLQQKINFAQVSNTRIGKTVSYDDCVKTSTLHNVAKIEGKQVTLTTAFEYEF